MHRVRVNKWEKSICSNNKSVVCPCLQTNESCCWKRRTSQLLLLSLSLSPTKCKCSANGGRLSIAQLIGQNRSKRRHFLIDYQGTFYYFLDRAICKTESRSCARVGSVRRWWSLVELIGFKSCCPMLLLPSTDQGVRSCSMRRATPVS